MSQELTDAQGEARACHCLGFAHYSLGSYREAIRYYEQDLALAKDLKDQLTMARALCNLGLAYKSLGQYSQALEYQYNFLQITHSIKNVPGKFRAMGNIGDILINMQNMAQAVVLYNQQLKLAKQVQTSSVNLMIKIINLVNCDKLILVNIIAYWQSQRYMRTFECT